MPPYTHTNDHVLHTHTQRRLRHITTPLHLHTTPLYTHHSDALYRNTTLYTLQCFLHLLTTATPLTLKTVKRLTHNNVLYTHQCLSQLHPTPPYRRKTNLPYTHKDPSYIVVAGVVVVNVDAFEQANDFRIERRQVVFYAKWRIRILEVRNNESPANWMPTHKPTEL